MNDRIDPSFLEVLPLFKDLTSRQLREAAALLELQVVPENHHLIRRDAPGDAIYLIRKGAVKVCATTPHEQLSVVHIGGEGEVFGEMAVMDGRTRSATVITLEESTVYSIGRHNFWTTLWEMPPVPYNLSCLLNQRLRLVTEQMQAMKHLNERGRVVRQIASLFEELGRTAPELPGKTFLPFHLSHGDLASLCGVPVDKAQSLLDEWLRDGILELHENRYLATSDLNALHE